ncbi:MAG: CapA family protein [Bacilli bacterium]
MRNLIYLFNVLLLVILGWGIYEVASFGQNQTYAPSHEPLTEKILISKTKKGTILLQKIVATGANKESMQELQQFITSFDDFAKHPVKDMQTYSVALKKTFSSILAYSNTGTKEKTLGEIYPIFYQYTKKLNMPTIQKQLLFEATAATYERSKNTEHNAVLSFVGDTAFGTYPEAPKHLHFDAVLKQNNADKDYVFKHTVPWFRTDDLSVINAESAFTSAKKAVQKMWRIKSKPDHVALLPANGIEVANLANNHTMDYYEVGYKETLRSFKANKVDVFNTNKPLLKKVEGMNFVFLGYDFRMRNSSPKNSETIVRDVKKYKKSNNIVIVNMHWGVEYRETPVVYQQQYAHAALNAGADIIVGQHPHRLQSVEKYKGKYIFYSLGDFAFGADPTLKSRETVILRTSWKNTKNGIRLADWWIVPTLENSDGSTTENNYQPLPVYGETATKIIDELKRISAPIPGGVKQFTYFDPF